MEGFWLMSKKPEISGFFRLKSDFRFFTGNRNFQVPEMGEKISESVINPIITQNIVFSNKIAIKDIITCQKSYKINLAKVTWFFRDFDVIFDFMTSLWRHKWRHCHFNDVIRYITWQTITVQSFKSIPITVGILWRGGIAHPPPPPGIRAYQIARLK